MIIWCVCFFKQKTAYEMRISDWSSEVCSSDLVDDALVDPGRLHRFVQLRAGAVHHDRGQPDLLQEGQRRDQRVKFVAQDRAADLDHGEARRVEPREALEVLADLLRATHARTQADAGLAGLSVRSEERGVGTECVNTG